MTTRDFKVFLEPDEDYGGYVVVCPSLPGCYSQGKTVPEALANIREAIDLCTEDMESRGEEIPDPNKGCRHAMTPKLLVISGRQLIHALGKFG